MFIKREDLVDLLETIDCENGYVDMDHLIECCNNLPSSGMSVWCMKCKSNGECMSIDKPNCFQMRDEPNCSEKPNNCEDLQDWKDRMWAEAIVTEPTISKMEQVDEPQTDEHCETCRHKDECEGATYEYKNTEWWCLAYAPIDEPQTDCPWK